MSTAPTAPIGPAAAALRVQLLSAVEAELMATLDAVMAQPALAPNAKAASTPPPAPQASPVRQAVETARAVAAGRQASSVPLFADLAQVQAAPALPAAVKDAIGQLLALRTPLAGPFTAQTVRQAVAQSGLFLEAHILRAPPGETAPPDIKAALLTLQRALAAVPVPAAPTAAATRVASTVPMAPVAPAVPAAPAAPAAPGAPGAPAASASSGPRATATPPPVQDIARSAQPAALPTLTARDPAPVIIQHLLRQVEQAAARPTLRQFAPLFADLAKIEAAPALPPAVKAAIGQILALPMPVTGPLAAQTIRQAVAQSAPLLEARLLQTPPEETAPPDLKAALLTLQRALAPAAAGAAAPAARPIATPPPVREAGLTAQAAALPTLSVRDPAPAIVQHLAREVDQATARQTLHQLASLPDGPTPTWMFELPIATPQGTTVAQFEIERDGPEPGAVEAAAAWRVRFSIDIEPLGPVHVHLEMESGRAAVTVWAEREDGLERLRNLGGELARALPADVVFHPGAPRRPLPESGRFVDQTS